MVTQGFLLYIISGFSAALLLVVFVNNTTDINQSTSLTSNLPVSSSLSNEKVWHELEFTWRILLATILGFLTSTFDTVGGVGSGGIFIPMLCLIVGFDTKSVDAVSKCMIMAASAASVWYNLRVMHPTKDSPILDYDLAIVFQSMLLLGITLGVPLSVSFPYWLITIPIIILFLAVTSMGEIFNDPCDDLVPEFELHNMARFDEVIYGADETGDRAHLFHHIAKTLREHIERQKHFCSRDFFRIKQLKKDLAGVCNDYDTLVHEHRQNVKRCRELEEENSLLRKQKNGEARKQVEVVHRLEQENIELLQKVEWLRSSEPRDNNLHERVERVKSLEHENAALIEQLSELSNALVQVSLERDRRSPIPTVWSISFVAFSITVLFVGVVLAFNRG